MIICLANLKIQRRLSPAICGGSSKFAGRDSRTEGDDLSTSSGEGASTCMRQSHNTLPS
jgi:hypothetical protein